MSKTLTEAKSIKNIVVLSVVAISVYIGFEPLINFVPEGIARSVVSSSFGAIFVIILTMYLLNKQTEVEQQSKRNERLFEERIKLFQLILDIVEDMLKDEKITANEISRLPFPYVRLCMLCEEAPIQAFQKLQNKLNEIYNETEEDEAPIHNEEMSTLIDLLLEFSNECRLDLQVSSEHLTEDLLRSSRDTIKASNNKRDYSKFTFDGVELSKARYIHAIIKNFAEQNPDMSLHDFEKKVPQSTEFRKNIWVLREEAESILGSSGIKRHYLKDDECVVLADATLCISNGQSLAHVKLWKKHFEENGIRTA